MDTHGIFFALLLKCLQYIFAHMKFLVAGLGNVGNEYAHTRHNIGFDVVMAFATRHGGQFRSDRLAFTAEVKYKGRVFICICPTTYMNLSGKAVKYWMDKEKIAKENLLVVFDDIAIPLPKIRLRPGGSDAGHNGLKSIQESLGTSDYPKLRFGIGNDLLFSGGKLKSAERGELRGIGIVHHILQWPAFPV